MERFFKFLETINENEDIGNKIYLELTNNYDEEEVWILRDQWLKLSEESVRKILSKISKPVDVLSIIEKSLYDKENGYFNKNNFKNDKEMFEEVMCDLREICNKIETFQNKVKYDTVDELVNMDINRGDPDSLFLVDEIANICYEMGNVKYKIECLDGDVYFHGVISKDSEGNYKLADNSILKEGQIIECLVAQKRIDFDEDCERVFWTKAEIVEKYDGELGLKYYDNINLDGLFYRKRH